MSRKCPACTYYFYKISEIKWTEYVEETKNASRILDGKHKVERHLGAQCIDGILKWIVQKYVAMM
jgi:hypothetical protein